MTRATGSYCPRSGAWRAAVQEGPIVPRASGLSVAVRKGVLVVNIYTAP